MRSLIIFTITICAAIQGLAQNSYRAYVKDKKNKIPLAGAIVSVSGTSLGAAADPDGLVVLANVPSGKQVIICTTVGFAKCIDTLLFPRGSSDTAVILMEEDSEEMEEVTVSTTRSSRTINDVPTRIELISGEELGEKANMKPGELKMVLSESTGIQVVQTSATSGNSGIRFEGMDGRYTQILKDGYPLFAGFSGGLGLMQTPPLDLKRIEVIKGASSTLYGGGAIAGLINLISKTPSEHRELKFLVNGTTARGFDASGFYSQLYGKLGVTMYAAVNTNQPYAPGNTIFTAIPSFKRYSVNPKFFWYPNKNTDVVVGVNTMYENRIGGDIGYIRFGPDSLHQFYEDNKSERVDVTMQYTHRFKNQGVINFKNSLDHFNRIISTPDNTFDGTQLASFTEFTYFKKMGRMEWIAGANFFTDQFDEKKLSLVPLRNYQLSTYGIFLQNTWDINKMLVLETGMRADYVNKYGLALLPRVSLLFKYKNILSSRLGGGLGYKAPTLFTEESERISYKNILPLSLDTNALERSIGYNWDINYKTLLFHDKVTFSVNQLFFYTQLENPLILTPEINNLYRFKNSPAHIDAKGAETNVKFGYRHFKLFLGYTYTLAETHNQDVFIQTPLTPLHHTNSVLMYEVENKWKIGLEAYYYSPQHLTDGLVGRDYWLCGFMAEKIFKKWSVYINFENMLDSRQTRFDSIYTGTISHPVFRDIYAPLDGFVANGGIKISL